MDKTEDYTRISQDESRVQSTRSVQSHDGKNLFNHGEHGEHLSNLVDFRRVRRVRRVRRGKKIDFAV